MDAEVRCVCVSMSKEDHEKILQVLDDIYYEAEEESQRYSHSGDAKDAIQNTINEIARRIDVKEEEK